MPNGSLQFDAIASGIQVWGRSEIIKVPSGRFGIVGITEVGYSLEQTVKYLDGQAQLMNTENNPKENIRYPMPQFFNCHNRFLEGLNSLIIQDSVSKFSCNNFYNPISDIISKYDQNLIHLPDHILDVFFEYTNILEGLLLVSNRRHINIIEIEDILIKLRNSYYKVYSLMRSSNRNDISSIAEELSNIKEEIANRRLLLTVEECEEEMEETFAAMNDEEKEDLARLLRKN